jgi:hypothetical protein
MRYRVSLYNGLWDTMFNAFVSLDDYKKAAAITPREKGEGDYCYRCRVLQTLFVQYPQVRVHDWEMVD